LDQAFPRSERGEVRVLASSGNWIEGTAIQQLEKTASLPGMKVAVGLPDLHPGKGSPIGAAYISEGRIYPTLVGNDIGCGIGLWRTGLSAKKLKRETWADRLHRLDEPWNGDAAAYLRERGIEPAGYEHSLGTIGSGNHFAELQAVEKIEDAETCARLGVSIESVYLCVHSGSRGLGEAILRDHVERYAMEGLASDSEEAAHYLARHDGARRWAAASREVIAARMLERLGTGGERLIDLCHNSVELCEDGTDCWLHRKGAAPSTQGPVVIPGSRGAFTYIFQPRDPRRHSGWSVAHGAGRKWSRSDSRARLEKRYSARDLARTDLGSHVVCEDKELLYEEAPQAYKNIDIVIEDLRREELGDVAAVLRPLVTYKVRR
jgi:release factor H-coupled RctB family protein